MSTDLIVPAVTAFIAGFALYKKVDIFSSFTAGAKEGLRSGALFSYDSNRNASAKRSC